VVYHDISPGGDPAWRLSSVLSSFAPAGTASSWWAIGGQHIPRCTTTTTTTTTYYLLPWCTHPLFREEAGWDAFAASSNSVLEYRPRLDDRVRPRWPTSEPGGLCMCLIQHGSITTTRHGATWQSRSGHMWAGIHRYGLCCVTTLFVGSSAQGAD